jgi:hypothetical protein
LKYKGELIEYYRSCLVLVLYCTAELVDCSPYTANRDGVAILLDKGVKSIAIPKLTDVLASCDKLVYRSRILYSKILIHLAL